jgi:hypothetical protein
LVPIDDLAEQAGIDGDLLSELARKKVIPSVQGCGGDVRYVRKSTTLNLEKAIALRARRAA